MRTTRLALGFAVVAMGGIAAGLLALAPPAEQPARKGGETHEPAKPSPLDALKALAGEWEMKTGEGQVTLSNVFAVTSNGYVIREIMFPGTGHEMTNMYHMDGDRLVVTHYCAIGNQPRMVAAVPEKPGVWEFKFKDCTNRGVADSYMGGLTLTIVDADHVTQDWTSFKDGQEAGKVKFELARRKK
ncbi:MAG: hypothetical protein FJ255_00640 [Phycisphaerae bacterium]|nr:hypothetical protein [Phycisphaerae bacterium]